MASSERQTPAHSARVLCLLNIMRNHIYIYMGDRYISVSQTHSLNPKHNVVS